MGMGMGVGVGIGGFAGDGPTTIPYLPIIFGDVSKLISSVCNNLQDRAKLTDNGAQLDGFNVPSFQITFWRMIL